MNQRTLERIHASTLIVTTLSSFLLLPTLGCTFGHGAQGPAPEDLTAIAAVLNKTSGPLTVTVTDPPATDVLEPDEVIFYEVSQSTEAREFEFQSEDSSASGSLRLLTGGELPGFATGLLRVSPGEDGETLTVDSDIEFHSVFALHRDSLAPGSSVFLIVNSTPGNIGIGLANTGNGALLYPNDHTAFHLTAGETLVVTLETFDQGDTDGSLFLHAFEAPASEDGEIAAFLAFINLEANELVVETQPARFRHLELPPEE